ncbi:MAG: hypothetical protein AAF673_05700 [Pseudomonadota bacterium]
MNDEIEAAKQDTANLIQSVIFTQEHQEVVTTIRILFGLDNEEFSFIGLSFDSHNMVVELSCDIEGTSLPITCKNL